LKLSRPSRPRSKTTPSQSTPASCAFAAPWCASSLRVSPPRSTTSVTDEAGHWDNSFPPKPEYHFAGGIRALEIFENRTDDVPTSGGFYHSWRRETICRGCYLARDGFFYGADETGTGAVGQYAAHPGDHNLDITIEWIRIEPDLEDLQEAVSKLRAELAKFLGEVAA